MYYYIYIQNGRMLTSFDSKYSISLLLLGLTTKIFIHFQKCEFVGRLSLKSTLKIKMSYNSEAYPL